LSSILLLQGCAGRNEEDFNNEQTQEHIAKAQREQGNWLGTLNDSSGKLLAGFKLSKVSPDTEAGLSGANNSGQQQVGLMGTVVLTMADGSTVNFGFHDAAYDVTDRVMRYTGEVDLPDTTKGTVEIEATFTDSQVSGRIWAGGWDQYGANFTARRDGAIPSGSALSAGRTTLPIARAYSATFRNPNPLDPNTATEPVSLRILDLPLSDPRFLDIFLPIVDVDLELTLGQATSTSNATATVYYKNAQLNTISGTLIGHADGVQTLSDLSCLSDGANGWNCQLNSSQVVNFHFTPVQQ
jgi:hypothetical protein